MNFECYTLRQMSDELAAGTPAPGGGTASAMAAMYGAALVEMVIGLTVGKAQFALYDTANTKLKMRLTALRAELNAQMDKDAAAFEAVMASFRLPKTTDEEKQLRINTMRQAFFAAALVPLATAKFALEVLKIAEELLGKSNDNAASDLLVGAGMCYSGCIGALANVAINIPSVKTVENVEFLTEETTKIKQKAEASNNLIQGYFLKMDAFAAIRA